MCIKGLVYRLSHDCYFDTLILIATLRPHTAGFHQTIMSIYLVGLFVPTWLLVRPGYIRSGTKLSSLTEALTGTLVEF